MVKVHFCVFNSWCLRPSILAYFIISLMYLRKWKLDWYKISLCRNGSWIDETSYLLKEKLDWLKAYIFLLLLLLNYYKLLFFSSVLRRFVCAVLYCAVLLPRRFVCAVLSAPFCPAPFCRRTDQRIRKLLENFIRSTKFCIYVFLKLNYLIKS